MLCGDNQLSKMPDVDINLLHNGKVSVYNVGNMKGVNNPDTNIDIAASCQTTSQGKILLTASIKDITLPLYSTVSNVQNLLGAHEFIGHGVKGWGDVTKDHFKVYEFQMKHSTWKGTSEAFKTHTQKNYRDYIYPVKK